ncbi:MAG: hypothetical protein H5T86_11075 [Armatimonadetes bacterium]|nr:hypothetical protein [Armatimonadota bacterium]
MNDAVDGARDKAVLLSNLGGDRANLHVNGEAVRLQPRLGEVNDLVDKKMVARAGNRRRPPSAWLPFGSEVPGG